MPKQPDPLPESGTQLARCHGVYVVARSLKLDYSTLKRHLDGSPRSASRLRKKSPPKFVELIGASRQTVDEYVIEFESARGRKLRIHCKTNTPPDWPVLLRSWR